MARTEARPRGDRTKFSCWAELPASWLNTRRPKSVCCSASESWARTGTRPPRASKTRSATRMRGILEGGEGEGVRRGASLAAAVRTRTLWLTFLVVLLREAAAHVERLGRRTCNATKTKQGLLAADVKTFVSCQTQSLTQLKPQIQRYKELLALFISLTGLFTGV